MAVFVFVIFCADGKVCIAIVGAVKMGADVRVRVRVVVIRVLEPEARSYSTSNAPPYYLLLILRNQHGIYQQLPEVSVHVFDQLHIAQ